MPSKIVECPRCNEADERPLGRVRCGLCECEFWVRPDGSVFAPHKAKKIDPSAPVTPDKGAVP